MPAHPSLETLLPGAAPAEASQRLLLYLVRRMAAGGLDDAFAAHAAVGGFGRGFRRPLILTRALMAEASRIARRKLVVAPCCCPRLTRDEAELLQAVVAAETQPAVAHARLCTLVATENALGLLTTAQAVAQSFTDLGRPLAG